MKTLLPAALLVLASPILAFAGEPSELVRSFYSPVTSELDPAVRDRFAGLALAVLEANDAMTNGSGEIGCIDFGLGIDGQDYDQDVIDRTLKLNEKISGQTARVMAEFELFPGEGGELRKLAWSLVNAGGGWKIEDIESLTTGWKMSEFDCN
ncbi:MAG: hypothetical protein WAT78_03880 [Rhizobiaceae bacterium]